MHTIERFYQADAQAQLLVTLPHNWVQHWRNLIDEYRYEIPHQVVVGGEQRYHSVRNAIAQAMGDIIGIHDGVRPFVSLATIRECVVSAEQFGSGVPCLPIYDSLRKKHGSHTAYVDRTIYFRIQTPQCFQKTILERAYMQDFHERFTDDASLVEELGETIHLVPGNEENIKITTPFDCQLAGLLYRETI